MRYKKFLLIPVLIFLYIYFIDSLIEFASTVPSEQSTSGEGSAGSAVQIGIGSSVSVVVTRPYLFGLLELPVYVGSLGDISFLHNTFFIFIAILTIIFVIIELRKKERRKEYEYKVV